MKIFESLEECTSFKNPVLTIGNYDGLHVGHREIIRRVCARAAEIDGTAMLMTFNPHPLTLVRQDRYVHVITPPDVKKRLIEETGIDVLWIVPFTEEFRALKAETFVEDILLSRIGIEGLIIGFDFRFGLGGEGNVDMLRRYSAERGFYFESVDPVTVEGEKAGSNRIRRMIAEGNVAKAKIFLGRPYMIEGTVVRGHGRGKGLGFPTVNLDTSFELIPERGVYITEAETAGGCFPAVTNIGYNPTFGDGRLSIETHLLDYSGDLYDSRLALSFHERLRGEIRFSCVDALAEQIRYDADRARDYFRKNAA